MTAARWPFAPGLPRASPLMRTCRFPTPPPHTTITATRCLRTLSCLCPVRRVRRQPSRTAAGFLCTVTPSRCSSRALSELLGCFLSSARCSECRLIAACYSSLYPERIVRGQVLQHPMKFHPHPLPPSQSTIKQRTGQQSCLDGRAVPHFSKIIASRIWVV